MPTTTNRAELEMAIAAGFDAFDLDELLVDDVRAAKDAVHYRERARPAGLAKAYDPETGMVELIANVQIVDRMGDLIIANPKDAETYGGKGWQHDYIDRVGIPMCWCHSAAAPVGRVMGTRVAKVPVAEKDAKGGKAWALIALCKLFDDPRVPLGQVSAVLMEEGVTGVSVGFIPLMLVWLEDEKERAKLGLGRFGYVIPQAELLELSIAPTPANQASGALEQAQAAAAGEKAVHEALERAVDQGRLSRSLVDDWRRAYPLGPVDAERRVRERLRATVPMARAWRQVEAPADLVCLGACEGLPRDAQHEATEKTSVTLTVHNGDGTTEVREVPVEVHRHGEVAAATTEASEAFVYPRTAEEARRNACSTHGPCRCAQFDALVEALGVEDGADPVEWAREAAAETVAVRKLRGRMNRLVDALSDALDEADAARDMLDEDLAPAPAPATPTESSSGRGLNSPPADDPITDALRDLACVLGRAEPNGTATRGHNAEHDPDGVQREPPQPAQSVRTATGGSDEVRAAPCCATELVSLLLAE